MYLLANIRPVYFNNAHLRKELNKLKHAFDYTAVKRQYTKGL